MEAKSFLQGARVGYDQNSWADDHHPRGNF